MSTPEPRPRSRPDATGFSTRAFRAASWAPGLLGVSDGLEDLEDLEADFSAARAAAAATPDGRPVPALGAV